MIMLKRFLSFFVITALIVGVVPAIVLADEEIQQPEEPATEAAEEKEQEEEPAEEKLPEEEAKVPAKEKAAAVDPYVFNGSKMTINKNIPSYNTKSEVPWNGIKDQITTVVVNNGVTSIGDFAFDGCENLTSVSLPTGLKTIGKNAFYSCTSLKEVSVPSSVTKIGNDAFRNCTNLKKANLPASLTEMGTWVFDACGELTDVKIADGAQVVGKGAFSQCGKLVIVSIPGSVKTIGEDAFKHCNSLFYLDIGYGVKTICKLAFYDCGSLISVTLPSSVTSVGESAFGGCGSLLDIHMTDELYQEIQKTNPNALPTKTLVVSLQDNPMTVKGKTAKVKYRKAKKKNQTVSVSKILKFSPSGTGSNLYTKVKGNKKISINNKTGKVTIKKKIKRGTYKVTVKVMSTGSQRFRASDWKSVTFKIKVK